MIVTLLTDFGVADHFVGVMKGVILSVDARIRMVDLSHEVPRGNVEMAAFVMLASYGYFPSGTVHVAVVDPGVGTTRRPIVAIAAGQLFVGPDNGLFSHVLEREPHARILHITEAGFFRQPLSTTFHGRDIFAPVGGALATGTAPESLGPEIDDPVRLPKLRPHRCPDGSLLGRILHVDRFGNCITSFSREDLSETAGGGLNLRVGAVEITETQRQYDDDSSVGPFAIWGSAGFLEISVNAGSAAETLGVEAGDEVRIDG